MGNGAWLKTIFKQVGHQNKIVITLVTTIGFSDCTIPKKNHKYTRGCIAEHESNQIILPRFEDRFMCEDNEEIMNNHKK